VRSLDAVLGECLDALFQGATVAECLARYPEQASELEPLLRLAAELAQVQLPAMPRADFEHGRRRVRDAVTAVRDGRRTTSVSLRGSIRELIFRPPKREQPSRWPSFSLLDAVVLTIVLLAVMLTFGRPFLVNNTPLAVPTASPTVAAGPLAVTVAPTEPTVTATPPTDLTAPAVATATVTLPANPPGVENTPTGISGPTIEAPSASGTPSPAQGASGPSRPSTLTVVAGPTKVLTLPPTRTPTRTPSTTPTPTPTNTPPPTPTRTPTATGVPAPTVTATPRPAGAGDPMALIGVINRERQRRGLSTLNVNASLMAAAQAHSDDLATNNRWGHTGSDGSTPQDRMRRAGYPLGAGEELLAGNSIDIDAILDLWLRNPQYQGILMNAGYVDIGAGYAHNDNSDYRDYWTVLVAYPGGASPPTETPTSTPVPTETPAPTHTPSPTPTPTEPITPSPTPTPTEPSTPSPTPTPMEPSTPSPTPTAIPSQTPTATIVDTPTVTPTPLPTYTTTATKTPAPTETTTPGATPLPSETPAPTDTPPGDL